MPMRSEVSALTLALSVALVALLAVPAASAAQQAPGGAAPPAPAPAVESAALDALDKMGAYLRTLDRFEIHSAATIDEVLDSGQKLQFANTLHLRVRRPDRLWAETASDRKTRQYFYDGKTFTIWGPRNKLYASFPAPATLREVVDRVEERYGLVLPLADLFRWGTDQVRRESIRGAIYVGPALLDGDPCDHFAFREEGVDWQIWLQKGDSPLPRKLVITTTDEAAQPQYISTLDWNLAPALNDKMFTFEPPPDAQRISIQEVTASPEPGG